VQLKSFRVRRFRNILDSGEISVESDVTALVGKNEAGKTALLQALYRLNPAHEAGFDVIQHYPRWMEVRDRKAGVIDATNAITATFALNDDDVSAAEANLGADVITGTDLVVSRNYSGGLTITVPCSSRKAVENVCERLELSATNAKRFEKAYDLGAMKRIVEQWRQQVDGDPETHAPQALVSLEEAMENMASETWRVAWKALKPRLPKFFYFDAYSQLPGRVDLTELAGDGDSPGGSGLQTARALLKLAGTETGMLGEETYEIRKAELEAVSNELTRQVFEYWKQNPDLSVEMDVDKETVDVGNGQQAVARFLETRVKDRRHGYTNNFDQRSAGFQWFFSFLAAFSEFEGTEEPVVVLLDEPALSLHGRAQSDYLRFIDERLAASHQVLYTTHSPFMVEPGKIQRARIVEDRGPDEGAVASESSLARDPDSLFPLQAALGYDIAQSLFVGEDNLVIEGTSDFTYLTLLSELLGEKDREILDSRWTLTPVGGAQNIPTFVALLGSHLNVTVLIDSSSKGTQRLTDMIATGLLEESRLIPIGEILERKNADIEDLFSTKEYLDLYNRTFGTKITEGDLGQGDRIIRRIAENVGSDFDHGRPAEILLRSRADLLPKLSDETLSRFETLIGRINKTLP